MLGIDISNHQKNINLDQLNYEFAIIKASEGKTNIDKSFFNFAKQLTELKKCIGAYHYARPDVNSTRGLMKEEAHNFISCVNSANLTGKAIFALDWEEDRIVDGKLANVWLEEVEKETGVLPFVYLSESMIEPMYKSGLDHKYPLWIAKWLSGEYELGVEPDLNKFKHEVFNSIWQYTSKGHYPGFGPCVDLDWTPMTKDGWGVYCISTKKKEAMEEKLSSDMQWAIRRGLFIGDGYGRFLPKEPLTREQAATVFKRFYDSLVKEL